MYNSLQYLRGISAVMVVYFHLWQTTGEQGVAIFFVISGFIMMDIVHKKHRTAKDFFKARFLRIAPLYYLLTIVTLLLGVAYDPSLFRIIQSFSFTALGSVLPVGYTLTYEFIFYTLVALSIYKWGGQFQRNIFIVIALVIGDIVLNHILTSRGYEYGNYFWFFIFGMISFYTLKNIDKLPKILSNSYLLRMILFTSIVYLFLGKYLGLAYYIDDVNHYLYNNLLASFLIVVSMLLLEKNHVKYFQNNILILLGNASFSIYLTHYILIHSVHDYYDKDFSNIMLFVGSIVIGIVTYKYLEFPMTKYTHKLLK